MDALFRDEEKHDTALLNEGPHAGKVGAFEGANYEARGYYRPQADCIMFTRDNVPLLRRLPPRHRADPRPVYKDPVNLTPPSRIDQTSAPLL